MVQTSVWDKCYQESWNGLICPEAFSHPAKFSKSLIFRIMQHALQEGWLMPGQTVLDCFAGVGLGGLPCLLQGVQYIGVELEERFVTLGNANLELWARKYGHLQQYKAPVLVQGDSRVLAQVLAGRFEVCVSSPPYSSAVVSKGGDIDITKAYRKPGKHGQHTNEWRQYGDAPAQLGNLPPGSLDACLSSPPFGAQQTGGGIAQKGTPAQRKHGNLGVAPVGYQHQGTHHAQLGNLPPGSLDAAISSPPYADGCTQQGHDTHPERMVGTRTGYIQRDHANYGQEPGQLGQMAPGQVEAVISSPPYEGSEIAQNRPTYTALLQGKGRTDGRPATAGDFRRYMHAYTSPGTLGHTEGTTFWAAARTILDEVYAVLKPGGVAIWIVKAYCRDGAIVDFPGQWRAMCEHVGFVTLHEHHAMLVEEHGVQGSLFGEDTTHRTERKSFFRRLHEKKRPDLAIDHETVLCMRKPAAAEAMPPDEAWQQPALLDACVASPPYVHSVHDGNGIDQSKLTGNRPGIHTQAKAQGYGTHPAQLGAMPAGSVEACIASPPFMNSDNRGNRESKDRLQEAVMRDGRTNSSRLGASIGQSYGTTPGQLGAMPAGTPPEDPAC